MARQNDMRRFFLGVLSAGAVLGLGALGLLGWQWMSALQIERIDVYGAQHADVEALRALAQVDTGQVMLDVDPSLVADRVRRHPWVATAQARRLPTGTFAISVQERVPVALALDAQGWPAYYLDRDGFAMPLVPGGVYDVLLLRGLGQPYHPVQPVQDSLLRSLLAALAASEMNALISEVELRSQGDVWLHTTPTGTSGSIPVWLGRDNPNPKLQRLLGFWEQAVLTRPEKTFALIDLRFDSQIVARETVGSPPSAGSR